ncbi:filamentous hemagglutinin N-terminal domain-containing protein [Candidatus Albibeggiatoa sp. nov. NOAA]|uniref:two-partner secretion domain-containing protein n=1 Tax=Candidatus Albibeggiatoa sp. nov. NOAA TaxID=3162724 RepID=UPI0032F3F46A|nr:filamentous hemagglutinin N-terminal domain-containing protein [Thiotrichaceae bacterium]
MQHISVWFILICLCSPVFATISINQIPLPSENGLYDIRQELGQTVGTNLFHSFEQFDLQQGEIAQFSGDPTIQNIITRITGGQPSFINGTLRSTIPHADFYFLNPYGVTFGASAQLDVLGSFHVSTADYLKLSDDGEFHARTPAQDILTAAPVSHFGFLTDAPADISIQQSQLSLQDNSTFSIIGGDMQIQQAQLTAPNGHFNLISIQQKGLVNISNAQPFEQQGTIQVTDNTNINVNGTGSGSIFIQAGQLKVNNAQLQANTLGAMDGQGIQLNVNQSIQLTGKQAEIASRSFGQGDAGDIKVNTSALTVNQGQLLTSSAAQGRAGDIQINSDHTTIQTGGKISSDSFAQGDAGNIQLIANEQLSIVDKRVFLEKEQAEFFAQLSSTAAAQGRGGEINIETQQLSIDGASITSNSHLKGDAGDIVVKADAVDVVNGGLVSAGVLSQSTGTGGNVDFDVTGSIHVDGFRQGFSVTSTDTFENLPSAISALTFGWGTAGNVNLSADALHLSNQATIGAATAHIGDAGSLAVTVNRLSLQSGGVITSSSGGLIGGQLFAGTGDSGTTRITAYDSILLSGRTIFNPSGIFSNTLVSGQGGDIEITTSYLHITQSATMAANSLGVDNAGNIIITADRIDLTEQGEITSSANQATGGSVMLFVTDRLHLQDSNITTSVQGGVSNGGNITIETPQFVVLNRSQIKAQADLGQGGNIRITADNFLKSFQSVVSASSRLGIDGNLDITSPDETISNSLLSLNKHFLTQAQIKDRCKTAITGQLPTEFQPLLTLKVNSLQRPNDWIEDWKPSDAYLFPVCD